MKNLTQDFIQHLQYLMDLNDDEFAKVMDNLEETDLTDLLLDANIFPQPGEDDV